MALSGSFWQKPAAIGVLLAVLCVTCLLVGRLRRRAIKGAQDAALLKRFGTADLDAVRTMAETYASLCEARDAAQASVNAKSAGPAAPGLCRPAEGAGGGGDRRPGGTDAL